MIRSVIHIDTRELSSWPISGKFSGCRLQHGCDVGSSRSSKPSRSHPNVNRPEFRNPALVCCMHYPDQGQAKQTSREFSHSRGTHKRCRRRGSLELSMLRQRAMEMSESIRKNRQAVLILKAHSHTRGNVVGGRIGASEFPIVVSVHGNAVV